MVFHRLLKCKSQIWDKCTVLMYQIDLISDSKKQIVIFPLEELIRSINIFPPATVSH